MPALRNNSWRRGDAEASTNMGIILGESRVAVTAGSCQLRSAWTLRLRSGQAREAPVPTHKNQRLLQTKTNGYSSASGSMEMFFSPLARFSQYFFSPPCFESRCLLV